MTSLTNHGYQVQQGVSAQRTYSHADAKLDAQLEHIGAGGTHQYHNTKHGHQRYDHVGNGGVEVSFVRKRRWRSVLNK